MKTFLAVLGFLALVVILVGAAVAFWTWVLMIAIGISHSSNEAVPALGFNATIPFGVVTALAIAVASGGTSQRK